MGLTLMPLVSILGGEVSPPLKTDYPIVSHSFNNSHLNSQLDIRLIPNSVSECPPQAPNQNHSIPPIGIIVLTPISYWSELPTFYYVLPMFVCTTIFKSLTVHTHQEYVSIYTMQRCHGVIESDPVHVQSHFRVLFPVTRVYY